MVVQSLHGQIPISKSRITRCLAVSELRPLETAFCPAEGLPAESWRLPAMRPSAAVPPQWPTPQLLPAPAEQPSLLLVFSCAPFSFCHFSHGSICNLPAGNLFRARFWTSSTWYPIYTLRWLFNCSTIKINNKLNSFFLFKIYKCI